MKIFFILSDSQYTNFFQSIYYCTKRIKGQGSTNPVREEVSNMRLISIYYWSNTIPKFFFRENVEQHWKNIPRMSQWWIQKIFPFIDNYVQLYIHFSFNWENLIFVSSFTEILCLTKYLFRILFNSLLKFDINHT